MYIQELSFIFILNMLMRAYSFNKSKATRSFILISFIYSLKILSKYNISPEIHLASSGNGRVISTSIKPILTNYQKCNEWTACFDFVFESLLILVLSWHWLHFFYLMMLDGFLVKHCIYLRFLAVNKGNQNKTSHYLVFIESLYCK